MKTITRFAIPALLAATAAVAGLTAFAEAPAKQGRTMDVEQIKARGAKLFEATDADGNDSISRDEFAAAEPAHPHGQQQGHRRMHPDMHPGMHDTPEARAELFKALDADGSGQLSAAEFDQLRAKASQLLRSAAFDRMDANKDGVLDATEYPPFVARAAALDTDGDGTVTPEERRAARPAKP